MPRLATRSPWTGLLALVLVVGLALLARAGTGGDAAGEAAGVGEARDRSAAGQEQERPSGTVDGLPTVSVDALPDEARETLGLIDVGGPFPYDRDGTVFGNREGLLPAQQRGYYREYTVPTPGEDDRGAKRIVAGRGGETYWTDDHYDSFARVVDA